MSPSAATAKSSQEPSALVRLDAAHRQAIAVEPAAAVRSQLVGRDDVDPDFAALRAIDPRRGSLGEERGFSQLERQRRLGDEEFLHLQRSARVQLEHAPTRSQEDEQ